MFQFDGFLSVKPDQSLRRLVKSVLTVNYMQKIDVVTGRVNTLMGVQSTVNSCVGSAVVCLRATDCIDIQTGQLIAEA